MYISVVVPGRTKAFERVLLARLGMNEAYHVVATFANLQECMNVADILNRELARVLNYQSEYNPTGPQG